MSTSKVGGGEWGGASVRGVLWKAYLFLDRIHDILLSKFIVAYFFSSV